MPISGIALLELSALSHPGKLEFEFYSGSVMNVGQLPALAVGNAI